MPVTDSHSHFVSILGINIQKCDNESNLDKITAITAAVRRRNFKSRASTPWRHLQAWRNPGKDDKAARELVAALQSFIHGHQFNSPNDTLEKQVLAIFRKIMI